MNLLRPASFGERLQNLDNRPLVLAIFLVTLGILLAGILGSAYPYTDARFVVGFFGTELQLAAFLAFATAWLLPVDRLGLRFPRSAGVWRIAPLAALALVIVATWWATRQSLPAGTSPDTARSWLVLRSTVLVGINEEWIFRGLLLAAFCRWWGLRRGAIVALMGFGAFHFLNMAGGMPLGLSAVQVVSTLLLGAILLMGAIDTRSLVLPMAVHAFYDFAVLDMTALHQAGANPTPMLIAVVTAVVLGIVSLVRIARLRGGGPYDD